MSTPTVPASCIYTPGNAPTLTYSVSVLTCSMYACNDPAVPASCTDAMSSKILRTKPLEGEFSLVHINTFANDDSYEETETERR